MSETNNKYIRNTMAYQLVINVTSPSILPSLKKVLMAIDGVSIEPQRKSKKRSATEIIQKDQELMESIKRGEEDLANGRSTKVSLSDINNILGI